MNYFELFGLPERPRIDHTHVSKKYIELQKKYHPDFFTDQSELDKEVALEQSAHINQAYKIFNDKYRTLEYFLLLKNQLEDEDKYTLPADFLMEMMDLNEKIDDGDSKEALEFIDALNEDLDAEVAPLMEKAVEEELNPDELEKLKTYYFKKKYLHRILDRIED